MAKERKKEGERHETKDKETQQIPFIPRIRHRIDSNKTEKANSYFKKREKTNSHNVQKTDKHQSKREQTPKKGQRPKTGTSQNWKQAGTNKDRSQRESSTQG